MTRPLAPSPIRLAAPRFFYDLHADGLKQAWHGKVWLNPPYAAISLFVAKLIDEMESGRVTEAIVLTANSSECLTGAVISVLEQWTWLF